MSFIKATIAVTAASLLLSAPVFAQGANSTTTPPTGRSDSDSGAAMKSGSMQKSDGMMKGDKKQPTANGTSTLAGPAGKMSDPANK